MNPYDWQSHNPRIEVAREALDRVARTLRRGGSAVVLGGRGMGKSVFLRQLRAALEADGDTRTVLVSAPPAALTVEACLGQLARRLGVAAGDYFSSSEIVEAYFAREDVPERLVLLFDEFDRYAKSASPAGEAPGRGFFNDLEATRRDVQPLGVLATGSLGVFVVRDVLGSSFLARALRVGLTPFARDAVDHLARPFAEVGRAPAENVLDNLHLAAGGIPALLTYGLQRLWELDREPAERDVAELFAAFRRDHGEYLKDLLRSVADPSLSAAPQRVLDRIRQASGPVQRSELEAVLGKPGPLDLDLIDVLLLLEAAGLVRVDGSIHADDPVSVHPIASILDLPQASPPATDLGERLLRDLEALLSKLHRASADFFRPGRGGKGKRLVPESVFAAHLALGFELLGWRTEREAQSAAGRTDLKLRRNASSEVMLVEVKIWGRNDYREAQRQIERYWTAEVTRGAVVQITDADVPEWVERYRRDCLEPLGIEVEPRPLEGSPIAARLVATSRLDGDVTARVDHYLLRLGRRP
jgi:energy-coupling factor transporter ATP-binding protein EcfA2